MEKRTFTCRHCGNPFERILKPSSFTKGNYWFCSPSCRNKARALKPIPCPICGTQFIPEKQSNGKSKQYCSSVCYGIAETIRIQKVCRKCGNIFYTVPNKGSKRFYCSKECRLADGWNVSDPTKKAMFTCKWCSKQFEDWAYRNPGYCSAQCVSEYTAHQPKPNRQRPASFIPRICLICGKEFKVHFCQIGRSARSASYCSKECKGIGKSRSMVGPANWNYIDGTNSYRGPNWGRIARKVRRRDNYTCQVCGKNGKVDHIAIHVHHIIPYRLFNGDHKTANRPENLISLCGYCHKRVEAGKINLPIIQKAGGDAPYSP